MINFKGTLKFLVSFLLLFAVLLMQFSFFISGKVLNGDFYKNTLNKNDYFQYMRKDIDFGFKNLSMITSIPEETFTNSVSNDAIIELANKNISSAEGYMKYTNQYIDNKIDTAMIYSNIEKYAQDNNIKVDEALKNQLLAVSKEAGNIINNHTILFNITTVDKYPQFQSFRQLLYSLYNSRIISVIATLLLLTLLVFFNKKTPSKIFLWRAFSFIPASMITLVASILALYYKIPNRFAIDNAYLKVALRDISLGYINYFVVTGLIILLIGICCTGVYRYLSIKEYNTSENGNLQ